MRGMLSRQVSLKTVLLVMLLAVAGLGYYLTCNYAYWQGYKDARAKAPSIDLPFSYNPFLLALPCTVDHAEPGENGLYKTILKVSVRQGENGEAQTLNLTVYLGKQLEKGEKVLVYRQASWGEKGVETFFVLQRGDGEVLRVLGSEA